MATKTAPPSASHRFFTWMRSLDIQREPGWIGGVAAGLATRLGIDPLVVRGIIVVVAILGGPALLVYAAAWLLLPDVDDRIHLERLLKGEFDAPIAGIGVLVLLALLPVSQGFWFAGSGLWGAPYWWAGLGRGLWTIVLLGLAVWLVVWIARRPGVLPSDKGTPAPPPPAANAPAAEFAEWRDRQAAWRAENANYRAQQNSERATAWRAQWEEARAKSSAHYAAERARNRLSRPNPLFSLLVIGVALLAGGITTLQLSGGEIEVTSVVAGLAVALGVLALGIIINGIAGRRAGGAAGVAWLLIIPLVAFTWLPQSDHFQYTSAYFTPAYSGGSGDLYVAGGRGVVLDLEDYFDGAASDQDDDVYLFVLLGGTRVILPSDGIAVVDATALTGSVLSGSESHGHTTSLTFNTPYDADKQLTVHVFALNGNITIDDKDRNNG